MLLPIIFLTLATLVRSNHETVLLPEQLLMGTATSAYQVEGAWNVDGRGESIWDTFVHNHPEKILDRSTGDVACNSYYKTNEDVAMLKSMGFQFYRFSISWSRVLPTGFENKVNPLGIAYYNNLIDKLLANGIEPVVTIFHFDLPQPLQDLGGWTNPNVVQWFRNYAKVLFDNFGDRVKKWITINEPKQLCRFSYGKGLIAPGIASEGLGEYLCVHYSTLAHASVYKLYSRYFRKRQNGKIGIVIDCSWSEPINASEKQAADRKIEFDIDMFAYPIFGQYGDYTDFIKKLVGYKSQLEGYTVSRLPKFTPQEVADIKGSSDFFGMNYYYTTLVKNGKSNSYNTKDMDVHEISEPKYTTNAENYIKLAAYGFKKALRYVNEKYGKPEIWIMENGFPTENVGLNDHSRISYYKSHLRTVVEAINKEKINIRKYTAWSVMDNFEWHRGYSVRFGLVYVNFTDPLRQRVPKESAKFMQTLLSTRLLPVDV